MKARHELKYKISNFDAEILKSRIRKILEIDKHASQDGYIVRSLYFDNVYDQAYFEKLNGLEKRDKFRIRMYNYDTTYIRLEKKSKQGTSTMKSSVTLNKEEVNRILVLDYEWMKDKIEPLFHEFYLKLTNNLLRPKVIIDYQRIPFIYHYGNIRITFDSKIKFNSTTLDFLNPNCIMQSFPFSQGSILEVKYDEYIPRLITHLLQCDSASHQAFSKYCTCRNSL